MSATTGDENPLLSGDPAAWDRLIAAVGPASLLVVIESRLSAQLRRQLSAEDIWQDTLLHAWRDRAGCQWRGVRAFRAWLQTIIDNRIREAADHFAAQKRGGGRAGAPVVMMRLAVGSDSGTTAFEPAGSTTPSRIAIFKEEAAAMQAALAALPDELREVARLRLFEQLKLEEIAERLAIGVSAVRHRFRKGSELYAAALRAELASRSASLSQKAAALRPAYSSPDHGNPRHGRG